MILFNNFKFFINKNIFFSYNHGWLLKEAQHSMIIKRQ